jgi:uncharacterized protein (TIGR02594 family)
MLTLSDQPAWMSHAWADLGEREDTSAASNPRILAYYADSGHPEIHSDSVAWCAAFVGACLERSGLRSPRSLVARSYLEWGENLTEPKLGSIAVFSRSSDPTLGHVGFIVGTTSDGLIILSGNQSDRVTVAACSRDRLVGLRWPSSETTTPSVSSNAQFHRALAHVLNMEGGYTDDPADPGGPTNLGITLVDLAAWKHQRIDNTTEPSLKAALIALTPIGVAPIYLARYWETCCAVSLPSALALMHFDAAVNHGLGNAARMLQQALGVTIDGEIGPETIGAAETANVQDALSTYADIRRARYRALPHFWRFGRGWLARVDQTVIAATAEFKMPSPAPKVSPMSDSVIALPTTTEPKWWGHSLTIWGTLITAASTVLPVLGPLLGLEITPELVHGLGDGVVKTAEALGGLIGTLMAITGRARATTPLMRRPISLIL